MSILNYTEDRSKYLNFTDPYLTSPSVFVTRSRDIFINGVSDLNGKKLAIVRGYKIDEMIARFYPHIDRIHVKNITEALRMVRKGDAFATAGSLLEMSYTIKKEGLLNLKITGDAKFDYELMIGVKKDEPLLLGIMNKCVGAISEDEVASILNKWVSIDYKKSYDYTLLFQFLAGFAVILLLIFLRYRSTVKYNKKLVELNDDLNKYKSELEKINKNLEIRVAEETYKRLEHERILMQQSKIAAMSDMMGAIAHQWRQPLNAVGLYVQELEDDNEFGTLTDEHFRETVASIMSLLHQMSTTIDDFSNFFKPDRERDIFNVCSVVTDVFEMLKPLTISKGIHVKLICNCSSHNDNEEEPHVTYAKGYPNEFRNIVLNILKNGIDAVENCEGEKALMIDIINSGEDDIVVAIADSGCGISDDIKSRIFEPYFSTKEEGKGVGLGLYMSKMMIKSMDGEITFDSSDKGSVFYIKMKHSRVS
jgi:signal transduction histidine kinase